MQRAKKIIINIVLTLVLAASMFIVISTFAFGGRVFAITSGSMSPQYKVGSAVMVYPDTSNGYKAGDVISFAVGEGTVVTHRVVSVDDGKYVTKGDANATPDANPVMPDNIIGRVTLSVPYAGYIVAFIQPFLQKGGFLLILAIVLIILIIQIRKEGRDGKRSSEGEEC